jgi:plasmid replication initiation protein
MRKKEEEEEEEEEYIVLGNFHQQKQQQQQQVCQRTLLIKFFLTCLQKNFVHQILLNMSHLNSQILILCMGYYL